MCLLGRKKSGPLQIIYVIITHYLMYYVLERDEKIRFLFYYHILSSKELHLNITFLAFIHND